jgi:hypothetical protein
VWAVYKKHYPPALGDEVWRLDKIGKDGAFHKRLNQSGIQTVEDFLRLVVMDPQRLRNVFSTTLLLAVLLIIVCVPLFCIVQNGRIVLGESPRILTLDQGPLCYLSVRLNWTWLPLWWFYMYC